MKKRFREDFENFLLDFHIKFIEFFSSQCVHRDLSLDKKEAKMVASEILDNIFSDKIILSGQIDNIILKMKKDGVHLGYVLNRVFLYTFENYLLHLKKRDVPSLDYIEKLIQAFGRFLQLFEDYIRKNIDNNDTLINFKSNNSLSKAGNIVDIIHLVKSNNTHVKFMNLYQGYMILGEGEVVDINNDQVLFKVENELQEIAMNLEGKAYILKDDNIHRYIRADIVHSDFTNHTVVLENFVYLVNLPASKRKKTRVYPDILVHVKLKSDEHTQIVGNLYDLSICGMGVVSKDNMDFYSGAKIIIEFELIYPDKKLRIETTGEIIEIKQHADSFRYCINISPDSQTQEIMNDYIQKRKKEIEQELRDEVCM